MADEAGRFTAEHTVMDKDLEIRELKHILEVKEKRIKELNNLNENHRKLNGELREEITRLKSMDYPKSEEGLILNFDDVDKSEDEFTEQLSFKFNQE